MELALYDLGRVSWQESQLCYHALARLGREGLILCQPEQPYLCLGYHQDAAQELELAWAREQGLPYFRREAGGGVVYLDRDQVFWQLVLRRDNPLVTLNRAAFYERFLRPVIAACRALGLDARLLPPNDVAVAGRRICGTGAGDVGDCVMFVGNLLRAFDPAPLAMAAAAPDAGFRRLYRQAMGQWITSLRRELGPEEEAKVSDQRIYQLLAQGFENEVGELRPERLDPALRREMQRQGERMLTPGWLGFRRKPRPGREVKIRAGLYLCHLALALPSGEMKCAYLLNQDRVEEAELYGTGDWRHAGWAADLGESLVGLAGHEVRPALEALVGQFLGPSLRAGARGGRG